MVTSIEWNPVVAQWIDALSDNIGPGAQFQPPEGGVTGWLPVHVKKTQQLKHRFDALCTITSSGVPFFLLERMYSQLINAQRPQQEVQQVGQRAIQ